jgi:hypothetical protein
MPGKACAGGLIHGYHVRLAVWSYPVYITVGCSVRAVGWTFSTASRTQECAMECAPVVTVTISYFLHRMLKMRRSY